LPLRAVGRCHSLSGWGKMVGIDLLDDEACP
jgi:hypothetical protein